MRICVIGTGTNAGTIRHGLDAGLDRADSNG